jgi:hypothetical protein
MSVSLAAMPVEDWSPKVYVFGRCDVVADLGGFADHAKPWSIKKRWPSWRRDGSIALIAREKWSPAAQE